VSTAQEAIARWMSEGITLNAGASEHDLVALSRFLGAPLPPDVRDLYRAANGMAEDTDGLVCFWSIGRILADPEVRTGTDERGSFRDVAFGDVLIASWFFCYRVRAGGVTVYTENTAEELPNLSELLRRYLSDPDSLAI
jgi:hypothetical protein